MPIEWEPESDEDPPPQSDPEPAQKKKGKGKGKKDEPAAALTFKGVLANLQKQYGTGLLVPVNEMVSLAIPKIPTGFFSLDYALAGGIPAARITLIAGAKGAAKTTTALRTVANYQQLCSRCCLWPEYCRCLDDDTVPRQAMVVWVDAEGAFDPEWAGVLGVDTSEERFYLGRPEFAEQAIDIVDAVLRTHDVGLVVVDSIAHFTPVKEIEDTAMNWQQGLQARLINKLVRKIVAAVSEGRRKGRMPTVLLINQLREKITGFGTAVVQVEPGGHGQRYASSVVLRLREREIHFEDKDHTKLPIAVTIAFKVQFSKVSPPRMEGEFTLVLRDREHLRKGDSDDLTAVKLYARQTGFVRKIEGGGWLAGDRKYRIKEQIAENWLNDRQCFARDKLEIVTRAHAPGMIGARMEEAEDEEGGKESAHPGDV